MYRMFKLTSAIKKSKAPTWEHACPRLRLDKKRTFTEHFYHNIHNSKDYLKKCLLILCPHISYCVISTNKLRLTS